jgi:hypothetical protein
VIQVLSISALVTDRAPLQDLLICVEMLIVALLHLRAFPYDIYRVRFMTQAPLIHEASDAFHGLSSNGFV